MNEPNAKELKDYAQILVYVFLAGGAWTMVKFLKEALTELKVSVKELTVLVVQHETRIALVENKRSKK